MKEKLPAIVGAIVVVALIGLAYYNIEVKEMYYYTQIDNTKVSSLSGNEMKYEYNLKMYDESGKSKQIKFKTSRELKDGAFIKVKYLYVSGVNKWEEVQYDDLPKKVQEHYKK